MSHSQVNPRSAQNWHTGRSPEHLVLRRRQRAHALKTDHLFARVVGCRNGVMEIDSVQAVGKVYLLSELTVSRCCEFRVPLKPS